jgi:putative ATPase
MERLSEDDLVRILERALRDRERGLGSLCLSVEPDVLRSLARSSQGDARAALNALEIAALASPPDAEGRRRLDRSRVEDVLGRMALYHDRAGEAHYDLASAFIKSMRDSDPDAALYWLARMLEAGEDPLFVARRIVRFASEDIGLADPDALKLAVAAKEAVHFVGRPEADLALAEAAVYCALAPRSHALETAWNEVLEAIRGGATDPVPLELRNAPTGLMRAQGYGVGYEYAHDAEGGITGLDCLPEGLRGRRFYRPSSAGFEAILRDRLARWLEAKQKARESRAAASPAPVRKPST